MELRAGVARAGRLVLLARDGIGYGSLCRIVSVVELWPFHERDSVSGRRAERR